MFLSVFACLFNFVIIPKVMNRSARHFLYFPYKIMSVNFFSRKKCKEFS